MPSASIDKNSVPAHIGVIMDGNGRWAQRRGFSRSKGHIEGAKRFRKMISCCRRRNIRTLTVYAFSTENWNRPKLEVDLLIKLFKTQLQSALLDFSDENIKVNFLGDVSKFPESLCMLIKEIVKISKSNTEMTLNIALNYGGRAEIVNAVKSLVSECFEKQVSIAEIDENRFSNFLYTKGQSDPDLIIRTGGEFRLSNFLLWQSAYSELFFTKTLWPDFKESEFDEILNEYASRKRRYGGIQA